MTSFELPPQYVSSQDGTFLDSIIQNGYAFEDRYDMAMSKNNKYGSLDDLLNALRALHSVNIEAIADWVPDQIYNLPGKEVVAATRVNNYGTYREGAEIGKIFMLPILKRMVQTIKASMVEPSWMNSKLNIQKSLNEYRFPTVKR